MKRQLKRIVSVILVAAMLPEVSNAIYVSPPEMRGACAVERPSPRLLVEALASAPVSQHRFPFATFVSFWSQYQRSTFHREDSRNQDFLPWLLIGSAAAVAIGVLHQRGVSWPLLITYALLMPVMVAVSGMNPPPPPFINLSIVSDPSSPNEIQIHVEGDQFGIFRRITRELRDENINLEPGTGLEPTEKGSLIRLIVKTDFDKAKKVIAGIHIPRQSRTPEPTRRLAISVLLRNEPGAIAQFLDRLYESIPALNIVRLSSFAEDGFGWVQLDEVTVPANWKGYEGRRPDVYLRKNVRGMTPLVADSEVSSAEVNEATLLAFDKVLADDTPQPLARRMINEIAAIPALLGWHGHLNEDELKSFTDVFLLAKKVHENEKRIQPGEPDYITHPKKVYAWLRKWGVKHPDGLKLALLHDVPEKLNNEDSAELKEQLEDVLQRSSRRLRFMLNVMTNYAKGRYATYAKRLTMYAEIILLAAKLADMIDNLEDIFEIDLVKNPTFSPSRQYAKRLRFGLPIVSWTPALKNDVYRNSRRDFLDVLIAQSEHPRLNFKTLYASDGEDPVRARAELVLNISEFLRWADRNPDCLPTDTKAGEVGAERIDAFKERLIELRSWLMTNANNPLLIPIDDANNEDDVMIDPPESSLFIDPRDILHQEDEGPAAKVSQQLTHEWFDGTVLEQRFHFYVAENNGRKNTDINLQGELVFVDSSLYERGLEEIRIHLTLTADNSIREATGPILRFLGERSNDDPDAEFGKPNPEHLLLVKPYFGELLRVFLRWLRDKRHYETVKFFILYGDGKELIRRLDLLRLDPDVIPYSMELTKSGAPTLIRVSLDKLNLQAPQPLSTPPTKTEPRLSRSA